MMAASDFVITALFQPTPSVGRKDAAVADLTAQLQNFKGFGDDSSKTNSANEPVPTTLIFTPSNGSTCMSLYPRSKTFTYQFPIDDLSCHATCESGQMWRITAIPPVDSDATEQRFTIERLDRMNDDDALVPVEVFRRCSVTTGEVMASGRRQSSADYGRARTLSVGHFSSGFGGVRAF